MLRQLVSRTRRRWKDEEFDLDLSYIVPDRVIVMSFPAQGTLQTMIRNDASEVKRFLRLRHGEKYRVFNVSEKQYEPERFDGHVSHFCWPDHHAPPFHHLCSLVAEMAKWLEADRENVLVIHCNSGKGRAGTTTVSILTYLGLSPNVYSAAQFFSK